MADPWPMAKIGDLADWRGGLTPSMANPLFWSGGDIPWISSKEVQGGVLKDTGRKVTTRAVQETPLRLTPPGSVAVVVRSGILLHTFPVALVPFETTVNQDTKIGTPRQGVLSEYLAYCMHAHGQQILERCRKTGTTVQSIDVPAFLAFEVPLPPLDVQRRIVDLLGALDSQIEALNREQSAGATALTTACCVLTTVADTGKVVPLLAVAEVLDRQRLPINEAVRQTRLGPVPYFGANGQVGWIDEALFDEPLVLLAEDGGPVSEWRTRPQAYATDGPAWVNNHAHVLRATTVPRDWLYFSLRHYDLTALATTGTRSKLTQANMRQIQIVVPDDVGGRSATLRSMEDVVDRLADERDELQSFRKATLSALLTGGLAISDSYDALLKVR